MKIFLISKLLDPCFLLQYAAYYQNISETSYVLKNGVISNSA